jgi:hypothetical protein
MLCAFCGKSTERDRLSCSELDIRTQRLGVVVIKVLNLFFIIAGNIVSVVSML